MEPFWALAGRAPPRYRPPWFGCGSIDTAVTHWWSAGQWSNMRSMTAAFSADPVIMAKYRAAASMDARPSMAWTWAGPAHLEARGEGVPAAVGSQALDAGVGADGEHDLGDAGDRKGAALPGPCGAGIAAPHVQPGRGQFPGAPGQRDEADLVALAVQADLAGAGGDREVLGVQAGALLGPRAEVQQHPGSLRRGPRQRPMHRRRRPAAARRARSPAVALACLPGVARLPEQLQDLPEPLIDAGRD